jgi:hypothetical protein
MVYLIENADEIAKGSRKPNNEYPPWQPGPQAGSRTARAGFGDPGFRDAGQNPIGSESSVPGLQFFVLTHFLKRPGIHPRIESEDMPRVTTLSILARADRTRIMISSHCLSVVFSQLALTRPSASGEPSLQGSLLTIRYA